jgi:hypothetical protein
MAAENLPDKITLKGDAQRHRGSDASAVSALDYDLWAATRCRRRRTVHSLALLRAGRGDLAQDPGCGLSPGEGLEGSGPRRALSR